MRNVFRLGVALLVGCSSTSASPTSPSTNQANPCATKGATYLFHSVETAGGTCGPVPDQIVNINADGTVPGPGVTCEAITQTGCTARNTNCTSTTGANPCKSTTDITFTADGTSASGLQTMSCTDATGSCTSTYKVTATRSGADAGDAGSTTTTGVYFAACLTQLAAGRLERVLRFYAETAFTSSGPATTGNITLKLTPLKLGPNNGPPPTVSKDQTVGTTYSITDSPTNAQGVYFGALGTVTVPGASNPISGRDIIIEQTKMDGRYVLPAARFCTQFAGHVTTPTDIVLAGSENTCVFIKVSPGDPLPPISSSDFSAGCPLM